MLHDFVIPKPPTMGAYQVHQLVEKMTKGERPQFVDIGDRLIVRSAKQLSETGTPLPEITHGDVRGFELRASCGTKIKGRHRYFPLNDWRARHAWLDRKARAAGFEVLAVNVRARRLPVERLGRAIHIDCSDFTGILRVTDVLAFRTSLEQGLPGPAKAFGHGMLVI